MKIYTKLGDEGTTELIGKRVPKNDILIEINGTCDEVLAYLSLIIQKVSPEDKRFLCGVIDILQLFMYEVSGGVRIVKLSDVEQLEVQIDKIEESLEKLKTFVLFDSDITSSLINIVRTIVRRLERLMVGVELNKYTIAYVNRLSDYLFVLARRYKYIGGV
jgi:cob(I)alamin adenosyltransferase